MLKYIRMSSYFVVAILCLAVRCVLLALLLFCSVACIGNKIRTRNSNTLQIGAVAKLLR